MPNLLYKEKSPYLLQHADNPIDWFPWCEEAFSKAKAEDKPVLLSIGYSTCFWCHKMAREAFSDEKIAEFLNKNFISIKVDREERPDIDLVYMEAAQRMVANAGWPLNIFLTPDKEPFFAGMYFPIKREKGLSDFLTILQEIHESWIENNTLIKEQARDFAESLKAAEEFSSEIRNTVSADALWTLKSLFDNSFGGFGDEPKFPIAQQIFFLLRYWYLYREEYPLYMVEKTLDNIAAGEIHDKKNGGFYRYAMRKNWSSPHFEKMLYANALMAMAYLEAYEVIGKEIYKDVTIDTLKYISKRLLSAEGGFYSAEDSETNLSGVTFIDEKISASGNGLAIAAFSMAGKVLDEPKYIKIAKDASEFVLDHLYKKEGRLNSYYIKGNSALDGFAADYAFMIWGLIELYQATYEEKYLDGAIKLNERLITDFWDEKGKGILFYNPTKEELLSNPKEVYDGVVPSINSTCAMNFIRLGRLTENSKLNVRAKEIISRFGEEINNAPHNYLYMLCAILYEKSTKEIIVTDKKEDMPEKFNNEYRPFTMGIILNDMEQKM